MRIHNIKTYDHTVGHYVLKVQDLDENQAIHIVRLLESRGYSVLIESYESPREAINHDLPHPSKLIKNIKHIVRIWYIKLIRRIK